MSKTPTKAGSLTPRLPGRLIRDEELANRISGGDAAAFDEMFRRYHQSIYRFCSSMVGPEDAKDMLQNVMTKAMTSMPENEDFQMKPWLYRVARNECIDQLRSAKRTEAGFDAEKAADLSASRDPHRATLDRERLNQLIEDLNSLPEKQRATLVMRELSGLGYPEIAESMGTTEAGAKQMVYEARLSLEQTDLGRKLDCAEVRESISRLDRRRMRGRKIRSHMRACDGCAEFERSIRQREAGFASLSPVLPVGAAAGILGALREGGTAVGMSGAGAASVAAGGVGTGVVAKGMVAVLVAGGVGAGAAEVVRHQDPAPKASAERSLKRSPVLPGLSENASRREVISLDSATSPGDRIPGSGGSENQAAGRAGDSAGRKEPGSPERASQNPVVQAEEVTGVRLTPGQGNGAGPTSLPAPSAGGQARADDASSAAPGLTGNPPPSRKPAAPPGRLGTAGAGGTGGGASSQAGSAQPRPPSAANPESPGKPVK